MWIEAISTKVKIENFYNILVQLTQFQPGSIYISACVFICLDIQNRKSRKKILLICSHKR